MSDSPTLNSWSVIHRRIGYSPEVIYDLNVAVLTHVRDGDPNRIRQFKRFGMLRLDRHRVHVCVIASPGDFEHLQELSEGWPSGVDLSLLEMNSVQPIHKINGFYLWLRESGLMSRWLLRVDDDSITDVRTALDDLDDRYGNAAVHAATSYRTTEIGGPQFQAYLLEKGYSQALCPHESESSFTSGAAMKRIFESKPAVEMLIETANRWGAPGDRALAFAAHIADVLVAKNHRSSADFRPNDLSIFGGVLYHIHHVPWNDTRFLDLLESWTCPRQPLSRFDVSQFVGRVFVLFRPPDKVVEILSLRRDGTIDGSITGQLANWRFVDGEIQLRTSDGVIEYVLTAAIIVQNRVTICGFSATDQKPIWARPTLKNPLGPASGESGDAWSLLPLPYTPWTGRSADQQEIEAANDLCSKAHLYVRIGHDTRRISFAANGTIQTGAADNERIWNISRLGNEMILTLGSYTAPICHLRRGNDGVWRGCWLSHEMMHVAVAPAELLEPSKLEAS